MKTKFDLTFETIYRVKTTSEIKSKFGVHPVQVSQWKKTLQQNLPAASGVKQTQSPMSESGEAALFEEIKQLNFELDSLKKS